MSYITDSNCWRISINNIIFIFFLSLNFLFSERGDLIEVQIFSTRDINNNQIYIDNELSALAGESFFNLTVEYGYWFYSIIYETIDINGNIEY